MREGSGHGCVLHAQCSEPCYATVYIGLRKSRCPFYINAFHASCISSRHFVQNCLFYLWKHRKILKNLQWCIQLPSIFIILTRFSYIHLRYLTLPDSFLISFVSASVLQRLMLIEVILISFAHDGCRGQVRSSRGLTLGHSEKPTEKGQKRRLYHFKTFYFG